MKSNPTSSRSLVQRVAAVVFCLVVAGHAYAGPKELYEQAVSSFGQAEYKQAITLLEQAKRQLGRANPKIESLLARAYLNAGDAIEAKVSYEKALKLTPSRVKRSQAFEEFVKLGKRINSELERQQKLAESEARDQKSKRLAEVTERLDQELQADMESRKQKLKSQQKNADWFYKKAKELGTRSALQEVQKQFPETMAAYQAKSDLTRQRRERNEALLKEKRIQPAEPLVDARDGQTYQTIKVGGRIFMAENLNYKRRGSYEAKPPSKATGRFYTWKAALKACPDGWELPDVYNYATMLAEISSGYALQLNADAEDRLGMLLKSEQGWWGGDAYDSLGFNGRPVGIGELVKEGLFSKRATYAESGRIAAFWTSTETKDKTSALWFELNAGDDDIDYDQRDKAMDLASVRCRKRDTMISSSLEPEHQLKVKEGKQHFNDGEYDAALALFDEAIALDPDYWEGYYWKGRTLYEKKDYPGTIAAYDEAARLNPEYHYTFHNRGLAKRLSGDPEGGIADFRHSLTIEPDSYWAHWQIALAYKNNLKDCKQAIPAFKAALDAIDAETASDSVLKNRRTIQSGLKTCYTRSNMWLEAFALQEVRLMENPGDASIINSYAWDMARKGQNMKRARELAKELLSINDTEADYLDTAGWVYYRSGDYAEAEKLLSRAVKRLEGSRADPGMVYLHLNLTLEKLGRQQEADEWARKACGAGKKSACQ